MFHEPNPCTLEDAAEAVGVHVGEAPELVRWLFLYGEFQFWVIPEGIFSVSLCCYEGIVLCHYQQIRKKQQLHLPPAADKPSTFAEAQVICKGGEHPEPSLRVEMLQQELEENQA